MRELMGMSDSKKDASVLDWDVPALWWGDGLPWGKQDGRDTVCVYSFWVGGRMEHQGLKLGHQYWLSFCLTLSISLSVGLSLSICKMRALDDFNCSQMTVLGKLAASQRMGAPWRPAASKPLVKGLGLVF